MSKDRARRRAVREAAATEARDRAERRRLVEVERRRGRDARARAVRRTLGLRPTRVRPATGVRLAAIGVTALAAPVVRVLVTDSARSRRTGYRRRP